MTYYTACSANLTPPTPSPATRSLEDASSLAQQRADRTKNMQSVWQSADGTTWTLHSKYAPH